MSGKKDTREHRWTPRACASIGARHQAWAVCSRCGAVYDFAKDALDEAPPSTPCTGDAVWPPDWVELLAIAAGKDTATKADVRAMALALEESTRELAKAYARLMVVDRDLKRYTLIASLADRSDAEDIEARALAEACARRGIDVVPMCDREPAPGRKRRSKR